MTLWIHGFLMLMNLLDFKREFVNFTDFKNIRISKSCLQLCPGRNHVSECFQFFFLLIILSVKKVCIRSETIFRVNFQYAFRNSLLKFILIIASLTKHSENLRVNILYKFCK